MPKLRAADPNNLLALFGVWANIKDRRVPPKCCRRRRGDNHASLKLLVAVMVRQYTVLAYGKVEIAR